MSKPDIDYSLYLVTGRELLPRGKDYLESLEESIQGGVTVVQTREKTVDTGEFLDIALRTKEVCQRYNVPLIVNDRIDIALAIGADGVHLGQSDMPLLKAKQIVPPSMIIGISVNNVEEAKKAINEGADYVGIGALWETSSKQLTSPVLGVRGVGRILDVFSGSHIKAVAIGGIKSTNALRALHGAVATSGNRKLDGLAVISDIMASNNPHAAASRLSSILKHKLELNALINDSANLLVKVREGKPLVHQITNIVVSTQSANTTLALGGSPIMSNAPEEMQDLSQLIGGLLINIGTITNKQAMLLAGHWANVNRRPIVFDPVGIGASSYRKDATKDLLDNWQATIIKGNAGEIGVLAESLEAKAKGVDSIGGFNDPANVVRRLAQKERCIVLLTGAVDWLSDGHTVLKCTNGHFLLGDITGSGCMLGSCVATFCAAAATRSPVLDAHLVSGNMLIAALGGLLALTVASEIAGERPDVKGTGTFLPALIDSLYNLTPAQMISRAKVQIIE